MFFKGSLLWDWAQPRVNAASKDGSTTTECSTCVQECIHSSHHHNHNRFTALSWDHPGEPVPEENFWTLWCKGRLTEADTPTIRLGATPSRLTSAHLHHPPFFTGRMPFLSPNLVSDMAVFVLKSDVKLQLTNCRPTNSVKALKVTSAFRLGRRR